MSPVIILGLVLMWAVVLIPMWLRRHDEAEQSRSVDRFSAAMHTLSRHEPRPSQRNVRASHRAAVLDVHVSGASAPEALAERRRRELAIRRARSLALLVAGAFVVFVAAVAVGGALLWATQVILDLSAAVFFAHLRRMALLAEASRRRSLARHRDNALLAELEQDREVVSEPAPSWEEGVTVYRAGSAVRQTAVSAVAEDVFDQTALAYEPAIDDELTARFDEAVALVSSSDVRMTANDGFFDQESDLSGAVTAPAAGLPVHAEQTAHTDRGARAAAAAAAEVEAVGGKPWEPIPVPRPTYSMKPAAPSYPALPRRNERLLPPVERTIEVESDDDLEAILDRRWAVND